MTAWLSLPGPFDLAVLHACPLQLSESVTRVPTTPVAPLPYYIKVEINLRKNVFCDMTQSFLVTQIDHQLISQLCSWW